MNFDPSLPDDAVNVSDTHPLREALVLVAGIAGVGLAIFVVIALAVELLVPRIPPSFEARIFPGSWVSGALEAEGAAAPEARVERVADLLDRLARHWPENPYALRVAVQDESTPNAIAFPGGVVLVTSGLLAQVASENELAFVLGHELGHFRNRDHLRGIGRNLAFALVLTALGFGGDGGAAQLAALIGELAERGFSREQEAEADRFALALVHEEYGHVAGTWEFFERLPQSQGALHEELDHYLATHPLHEARVEALEKLARERGWSRTGTVVLLERD